jgi:antitoxin (DNA-binding transcriptional repressor) of toxin-antitoxin stability system
LPTSAGLTALPEVLDRVAGGEELTITRHGRPVAVVVRPDSLRSRSRAAVVLGEAGLLHGVLAAAQEAAMPRSAGLTEERAEELISAIQAGRDAR